MLQVLLFPDCFDSSDASGLRYFNGKNDDRRCPTRCVAEQMKNPKEFVLPDCLWAVSSLSTPTGFQNNDAPTPTGYQQGDTSTPAGFQKDDVSTPAGFQKRRCIHTAPIPLPPHPEPSHPPPLFARDGFRPPDRRPRGRVGKGVMCLKIPLNHLSPRGLVGFVEPKPAPPELARLWSAAETVETS